MKGSLIIAAMSMLGFTLWIPSHPDASDDDIIIAAAQTTYAHECCLGDS